MDKNGLLNKLALALVSGVGSGLAQNLISHIGCIDDIFREKTVNLQKIPGIGPGIAKNFKNAEIFTRAEKEIRFMEKNNIKYYFFKDPDYPARLKQCQDAPIILFYKGGLDPFPGRALSIIGTRNPSTRGRKLTREWVRQIAERDKSVVIISGLAYGIDIQAHEASLEFGLNTYAALGHGFHTIYPAIHRSTASKITGQGALLTDFFSNSILEPKNFIRRNRLIAGLSDSTLVIESKEKGGAMVTADLSNSYNRDVYAVPGRPEDPNSYGCNKLIKTNRAALVESVDDIFFFQAWDDKSRKTEKISPGPAVEMNEKERIVFTEIGTRTMSIDQLSFHSKISIPELSAILLNLEFKGLISAKPGNCYMRNF
jgi:DNA processing protein